MTEHLSCSQKVEKIVIPKPEKGDPQKGCGLFHEVPVPVVFSGDVVPAWRRAVRTLNKKAEMGLNDSREEDDKQRPLDATDSLRFGFFVLDTGKRDFNGLSLMSIIGGNGAREH